MKYNLRSIMKRAWELVKGMAMSISASLKQAWREAKMEKEIKMVGSEKQVKWANDIIRTAKEAITTLTEKAEKSAKDNAASFWKGDEEATAKAFAEIESKSELAAAMYTKAMVAIAEEKGAAYIIEKRNAIQSGRVYEAVRKKISVKKSEKLNLKNAVAAF